MLSFPSLLLPVLVFPGFPEIELAQPILKLYRSELKISKNAPHPLSEYLFGVERDIFNNSLYCFIEP